MLIHVIALGLVAAASPTSAEVAFDRVLANEKLISGVIEHAMPKIECVVKDAHSQTLPSTEDAEKDAQLFEEVLRKSGERCDIATEVAYTSGQIRSEFPDVTAENANAISAIILSRVIFSAYAAESH